jgi:hypothetical protein
MDRTDIINKLIAEINAKTYLEIGVADGVNFSKIQCNSKVGVDPAKDSNATVFEISDDFFKNNTKVFDVIFIDGLHHADQVYKDINNALSCISDNGYIVCHDMLPPAEEYQVVPPIQNLWTGDCWKAWIELRTTNKSLTMYTVDTDFGCGIISKGYQELLNINDLDITWSNFVKNKNIWMSIISVAEFEALYLNKDKQDIILNEILQ